MAVPLPDVASMWWARLLTLMRQAPAVCASERLEAAWDREVGVPPGVRTDSKTGSSSHTGLATAETGSELTLELL